jgi:predicted Kef-type K+ transport protein
VGYLLAGTLVARIPGFVADAARLEELRTASSS